MSIKTKLTSLITTFILLCSLLTVGVFAVKNTTFNVGGDIVFNVQGIEADIELTANGVQNAVLADNAVAGTDVMNKIQIRNNTSADSIAQQFAKWSNLDMTFAEGQSTATIELKISNVASETDNYIDLSAVASATTKENARISVANNDGGVCALLKSGENATFTITFSVIDDEYKASLNDFSVNFDMQKKVLADFDTIADLSDEYEFSEYSQSAPYTVAIGAKGASDVDYTTTLSGDIVIPAYVNNGGTIYAVNKLAFAAFGHGGLDLTFDFSSLVLPKTLTIISNESIYTTNSLTLEIPYGLTTIEYSAFHNSGLTSITIPDTVTTIEYGAFGGTQLNTINYYGTQEEWNVLLENVGEYNDELLNATINFNYTGE